MWGRFWNNLYRFMIPYPDKPSVDPSEQLRAQNYTVEKMFHTADDFFASMGLLRAPDTFWERSMLRKPDDGRQVMCHATAWDFSDGQVSASQNTSLRPCRTMRHGLDIHTGFSYPDVRDRLQLRRSQHDPPRARTYAVPTAVQRSAAPPS